MNSKDYMLITDIDNTLIGDDESFKRLMAILKDNRERLGFGMASGRSLERIQEVISGYEIDEVDVTIASVGTEIYYGNDFQQDLDWEKHINVRWDGDMIREIASRIDYLEMQTEEGSQREFKISYNIINNTQTEIIMNELDLYLSAAGLACNLVFSHGIFLDILPERAAKGKAVEYVAEKYGLPLERISTAGDSGNDRDMLINGASGIVVGNYDGELEDLKNSDNRIYFATGRNAAGIIEGLGRYGFLK